MGLRCGEMQWLMQGWDPHNSGGASRGAARPLAIAFREPRAAGPGAVRRPTSEELMASMLTLLGGVGSPGANTGYTGYAGEWLTWEVLPASPGAGDDDGGNGGGGGARGGAAEPRAADEAGAGAGAAPAVPRALQLVDDAVNIRLWREEAGPGRRRIEQANLYQAPEKMAGSACTRFAPYLRADATRPGAVRPDGYGLRSWTFDAGSELVSPSAAAWLDGPPPSRAMRVLAVPSEAAAIVNGALPAAFVAGRGDIWDPASEERRWASMNWYEDGLLVVNRSINEDRIELPADLASVRLDPAALRARMAPRRDSAPLAHAGGADGYVLSRADWGGELGGGVSEAGTATVFSWDGEMRLVREEGVPCRWGEARGGPGPVVEQVYPDCSYCSQPADLRALAAAGGTEVTFEAGAVLRDGGVARWLLTYGLQGRRLVKRVAYERYGPAGEPWGA
ncbi:hypothetical protein Rsub_01891 [Raphidocelis subcapitata]|uniref:Uncharacterized protein n=1 Tax=Raphidocelis subcapitata TaxID=307507 RepID=A0A2V0NNM5_9CHLO|nr:hypothetical protein Rsub_01891 [Raphidocelis subcapitata]|eukprot:GBF89174.1 hypothetical protein Rsub_01891 [Raphidocelis subcapitata]